MNELARIDTTPAGAAPADAAVMRLLIVDDIPDNREILARRLQRRGFSVTEAAGGVEALQRMENEAFDLVLLDIRMPDIDGLEVLRRVRVNHSQTELPVIMCTANNASADVVDALAAGANDYVSKPIDFPVLLARVTAQVERRLASIRLAEANQALNEANSDLERRVAARTLELRAINDRLQREIAQREQADARTMYLAYHDALTGLGNRVMFRESVQRALDVTRITHDKFAIFFIDLDGFKGVNDTLGHSVGDGLLKALAIRLRDQLPDGVNIARLGGDEFGVLMSPCADVDAAIKLANQLIELVSAPVQVETHPLNVAASVGIAFSRGEGDTIDELLKCADLAMYRAKEDGRGVAGPGAYRMFDPEMDEAAQSVLKLKSDLRRALSHNEFVLHYQPIVSAESCEVKSFEALVRWQHPQLGLLGPNVFLPLAESTGLIVQIGDWVLREACREAMNWPEEVKVAVNLSPVQFQRGALVATAVSALAEAGLAPGRLELEITETVLLDKTERNLRTLESLRELGVRISMDDFGTGYSSLSYLRTFPFDKIKIDQSFVRSLSRDGRSMTIVSAIAGLGQSFGITTVAEGVETEDQIDCLIMKGCSELQGRFYSMPVPAGEISKLLVKLAEDAAAQLG
ncbi:MAG: EAL domain-containing protein [Pseudomonadota bacterium]|nr:EAL domain-containing protein [Pseudomonadota bacterium]